MKRTFLMLFFAILSMVTYAQRDVTKFMGIPVDGFKPEMKKALIEKGFIYNSINDYFYGEFNGREVDVHIVTNNNKVWRITVSDKNPCNETDIKIRFNTLCHQFEKNEKYLPTSFKKDSFIIPDNEDISYEMAVNNKRYEASYIQEFDPTKIDTLVLQQQVLEKVKKKYSEDEIFGNNEELKKEINAYAQQVSLSIVIDIMSKKSVWFMINELYGKYYITIFYDNEYNHANGEDL